MSQLLDPLPQNSSESLVCCYVNKTSTIQIGRITNIPNWYFERVIFPGQRLLFECSPEAQLEIYSSEMSNAILAERIECQRLSINV